MIFRLLIPLFLAFFSLGITSYGQNLVPNGSFEDYRLCPDFIHQIERSTHWYTVNGTPDYFHACASSPLAGVPVNSVGYKLPRTGSAYAHLGVYAPTAEGAFPGYKEFMQTRLRSPLQAGRDYAVSFYVSLSDSSKQGIDGMGLYLSRDSLVTRPPGNDTLLRPQITNLGGKVLRDKTNWTRIAGIYRANGGEQYLTIGNFYPKRELTVDSLGFSLIFGGCSYYIEDVSVLDVCDTFNLTLGPDQTLCLGEQLRLRAGAGFKSYLWQDGSTQQTLVASRPGLYWVEVQTPCGVLRDSILLQPGRASTVFLGRDTLLCQGEELVLRTSSPGAIYEWQDGSTNSFFRVNQPGLYWVQVYNDCGSARDSILISGECPLWIPNVITPNGDSHNEFFEIRNPGTLPWQLDIYNRWGRLLYHSDAYRNTWNAPGLPTGAYYYLLTNQQGASYKGWLQVLR